MPLPIIRNEKAAVRTNHDGLDFILLMATPPQEKGKVDVHIRDNQA